MKINSTEIKNNFGKYLRLSATEDIIITKNGHDVAKLTSYSNEGDIGMVKEAEPAYSTTGTKISYEDFLKISEASDERFEYIDGEIYLLASPKVTHQSVLMELTVLFYNFFQGKTCQPAIAPFDITLKRNENNINIVQPDLMVICDLDEHLNESDYYMGVPTLALEIISASSRNKDYIKKLDLYGDCGVKEYWIVNPFNQEITVFYFDEKNIINNQSFHIGDEAVSYHFSELKINLKDIFK